MLLHDSQTREYSVKYDVHSLGVLFLRLLTAELDEYHALTEHRLEWMCERAVARYGEAKASAGPGPGPGPAEPAHSSPVLTALLSLIRRMMAHDEAARPSSAEVLHELEGLDGKAPSVAPTHDFPTGPYPAPDAPRTERAPVNWDEI